MICSGFAANIMFHTVCSTGGGWSLAKLFGNKIISLGYQKNDCPGTSKEKLVVLFQVFVN